MLCYVLRKETKEDQMEKRGRGGDKEKVKKNIYMVTPSMVPLRLFVVREALAHR
jgi:hypothetical protein